MPVSKLIHRVTTSLGRRRDSKKVGRRLSAFEFTHLPVSYSVYLVYNGMVTYKM